MNAYELAKTYINPYDIPAYDVYKHNYKCSGGPPEYPEFSFSKPVRLREVDGHTYVVWVFTREDIKEYYRLCTLEKLYRLGYKFRKGPVPNVHNYKNRVDSRSIHGILKEMKDNLYCTEEYPEYNLVRPKRVQNTLAYMVDYSLKERHFNSQRSWKRSKKARQWM